jgi:catechol 2,3-dioxygenase-like lactoylglutathione lyase family enzyme
MRRKLVISMLCLVALGEGKCNAAAPARPRISGITFVRIGVGDLDAATAFYQGRLRLPNATCFGQSAKCLFVNPSQQIDLVKMDKDLNGDRIGAIGILTSDARALRDYLLSHGEKPEQIVTDGPGRMSFQIKDPENHALEFVQVTSGVVDGVVGMGGPLPHDTRIIHSGFVVRDRDAMDRFYKDILGFHVYWNGGMKDGETDWVDMQVPDGTDWIEYMLNVPANADKRTLGVMNHIALGVPNVRAAAAKLEKAQGQLPADQAPKIGRDGKWQLNLYDPDETRVELMEFSPAEKPCCADYTGNHPKP